MCKSLYNFFNLNIRTNFKEHSSQLGLKITSMLVETCPDIYVKKQVESCKIVIADVFVDMIHGCCLLTVSSEEYEWI